MKPAAHPYKTLILVCTNLRENGKECCAQKGGVELHQKIKEACKALSPDIRVSKTGCLDSCATGATVVIIPDNIWLGDVTENDIPTLIAYLKDGTPLPVDL